METKRIIVDELPESCRQCQFIVILGYAGAYWCSANKQTISKEYLNQLPRPAWCPLEVEEICVWKKKDKATDDDYDIWVSPHFPHVYRSNLDFFPATFCRDCGKRIRYEEE